MGFYRVLLHLLPASFRGQYGAEMRAVFARRRRELSNPLAWAVLWLETLADLAITAVQAHWDILRQDLRHAVRTLRRSLGFALTAVAVTALGVGATTAAFSVTDHVLLRPLPFHEAGRLVKIWENIPEYSEMDPSPANFRDWRRFNPVFESMAAYRWLAVNLSGSGQPVYIDGASVTAGLFPMLGVQPALGRFFSPEDDRSGANGTVLLSDRLWRTRFAADPLIVGRKIVLDGTPYVVIGVMRPDFYFPRRDVALWTPMRFGPDDFADRNNDYLQVLAKLPPDTSIEQAVARMRVVATELERQYPKENAHVSVTIKNLHEQISEQARMLLLALVAASLCLLLITCTNLANLLLARGMVRRKEIAVRTALGAGRERLVRQLLTESLLLALAGGALGIFLAVEALPLLVKLVPNALPIAEVPAVDWRVLSFAALLTTVTGIGFGVVPALRSSRPGVAGLHEGSRSGVGGRRERLRAMLVAGQVASSIVLLICCGLLIRALWRIEGTDPGFRTADVLTMRTSLPMPKYEVAAKRVQFYTRVLSNIKSLPGVRGAAYISFLPIVNGGGVWPVEMDGESRDPATLDHASLRFVTPGFFATLGIPLLAGRDARESDRLEAQRVAIVSASFVRRYWPGQSPLGRHFTVAFGDRTVVGVVGDIRVRGLERNSEPQVYLPYRQVADGWLTWYAPKDLAIRTALAANQVMPAIRRIIAAADPEQPISDVQTLSDIVGSDSAPRAVQVRVLSGFAFLAFVLAGVGVHGLLSFSVSTRSQEFGVRIAIGAQSRNIFGMVLREGALLCAVGGVAGLVLAYAAGRWLQAVLAGVNPGDPIAFLAGLVLIVLMALAGTLPPALRAVRTDPISVIRND
ncbi:MAG TPA: ABC transporter permease [Bryobacteraceae bacterium]